jgi:hypothetical protein
MKGKSRSAKYYQTHPKARAKKKAYDKEYHATPARKKYRRELQNERYARGIAGKGGGDLHHSKSGLKRRSVSANRGDKKSPKYK